MPNSPPPSSWACQPRTAAQKSASRRGSAASTTRWTRRVGTPPSLPGLRVRKRLPGQPLPEAPAGRTDRDVAAADLARDLDPEDLGDIRPPRVPDLDVAAADGDVVGVRHDAWPGDDRQVAAADLGIDAEDALGDFRLGQVKRDVPAGHLRVDALRDHPAALPLGVPAPAV